MMKRWLLVLLFLMTACGPTLRLSPRPPGPGSAGLAQGVLFEDKNGNGIRDQDERALAGVKVSNGGEHHHFNAGTASGSWYRGAPDEVSIPNTTIRLGETQTPPAGKTDEPPSNKTDVDGPTCLPMVGRLHL